MTKKQKLIARLLRKPKDFRFQELHRLLGQLGYTLLPNSHTGGSRVAYHNHTTQHLIRLHRPHPSPCLKPYQITYLIHELKKYQHLS